MRHVIKNFKIETKFREFEVDILVYVKAFCDKPATYYDPAELEIDYDVEQIEFRTEKGIIVEGNSLEKYIDYSDLDEKVIHAHRYR